MFASPPLTPPQTYFWLVIRKTKKSLAILLQVPQMVSVILEKSFKIKDNGRDYKYKSLEGARFLPRNILFLSGITL